MTSVRSPIGVVNYGVGNLGSILNMLRYLDLEGVEVADADGIARVDRLILPGVGAFDPGVSGLAGGLDEAIRAFAASGSPLLGVCLGMQLLARSSEEGTMSGLGIVAGECHRLTAVSPEERIPHMGWDWIQPAIPHPLVDSLPVPSKFYFAHSYALSCDSLEDVVATTNYAGGHASVIAHENIAGAQFHPEKSHRFGMAFLTAFSNWRP